MAGKRSKCRGVVSLERELHAQTALMRSLDHLHISGVLVAELLVEVSRQWV
jgi:hypothetical protein